MWLINAVTLKLEEYLPEQCPPYAILSHRWGKDEVSFKDMGVQNHARRKADYSKIEKTCKQALLDGLQYAWIDTCCINKESSAELSEAINSMVNWYARARVCYAFLSDVSKFPFDETKFMKSVWFTRGWTLQELLAPRHLLFFNRNWRPLGSKSSLRDVIHHATGIAPRALEHAELSGFPVAQKMSWAAQRVTTRTEDIAYCLMGIFDVNMPLLYGEGYKAFMRLQEEIIRRSPDASVFSWQRQKATFTGMLASTPRDFKAAGVSFPRIFESRQLGVHDYMLTNRGVSITFPLYLWRPELYIAPDVHAASPRSMVLYRPNNGPAMRIHCYAMQPDNLSMSCCWRGWNHEHCGSAPKRTQLTVAAYGNRFNDAESENRRHYEYLLGRTFQFEFSITQPRKAIFGKITCSRACENVFTGFHPDKRCMNCFETIDPLPGNHMIVSGLQPGEYGTTAIFQTHHRDISQIGFGVDFEGVPFLLATRRTELLAEEGYQHPNQRDFGQALYNTHIQHFALNKLIDEEYRSCSRSDSPFGYLTKSELQERWTSFPTSVGYSGGLVLLSRNGIWAIKSGHQWKATLAIFDEVTNNTRHVLDVHLQLGTNEIAQPLYSVYIDISLLLMTNLDKDNKVKAV